MAAEKSKLDQFLEDTVVFLGPDREILKDHGLAPRDEREERVMREHRDPHKISLIRAKLDVLAEEAFDQLEQTGAAAGAKWGDLISGVFTASGDLAQASTGGVLLFSVVCQPVLRYINKYWKGEPTVGIRPGDIFMSTDPRFGNIHTPDQNTILPIFDDKGELVLWVVVIVHEGENGSVEPGGMPSAAESPYMEGIRMPPCKVGENYEYKKDWVTYLQNSVRDPMLQVQDMKVRLAAVLKMRDRINDIAKEYGWEAIASTLRWTLEDTEAEVRRRLQAWPEGVIRSVAWTDSTLRENALIKISLEARKKNDELILDFRGTSPQFVNRSINTQLHALKGMLAQVFLTFVWPDLPRNQAVFAPMRLMSDWGSALDSTPEAPNAQSMMTFFPGFTALQMCVSKFLYPTTKRYTKILAPWYNMITTFIYGGVNQYGETVGNLCADLNGMSGGAREDADGEHSIAPIFAAMTDLGENEIIEEETPIVKIVPHRLLQDNQGFGKFRGGSGYQVIGTVRRSDMFGFMTTCTGSKFPTAYGLYGGYGAPSYPLCKIKGVNAFETLKTLPESKWTVESLMNEQPIPGAKYSTHHMGLQFEIVKQGELYMICQGAGGGYGDPLDRDAESVTRDLRDGLISPRTAKEIYRVAYDERTLSIDVEGTETLRSAEREARKKRGKPFDAFVKEWVKPEPPKDLPYYGPWGNREEIYLGSPDNKVARGTNLGIMMTDPREVRIAELEKKLKEAGIDIPL